MCLRIQRSRVTVKALHSRLQHAYQRDAGRVVRRLTGLLDLLVHQGPMAVWCERWGLRPSCLYDGRQALLRRGIARLVYGHGGGRRPKLPPRQRKRWGELIEAGPLWVGFETACWHALLIRVLIWRECGVLDQRHYVCTLLRNRGFSCHKAPFGSAQLDAAQRLAWLEDPWPAILRAAKRGKGLRLCEEEASFAPGGSLR